MADQSSNAFGLPPTVWVVIIVGLAGALAATQYPFQDVRPSDSSAPAYRHAPSQDQDIEARQWEDPFSAVAVARRINGSAKSESASTPSSDYPHDVDRLTADRLKEPNAHVLVLGAMVPGAPYADDIETRRRIRYAVLAGLFQESYVPDDSEHIGFVTLSKLPAGRVPAHDIAAYEWLHRESSTDAARQPRILLLWLDQDGFQDKPLRRFSSIVNSIAGTAAAAAVSAAIIGPADSSGLKVMSKELDEESNCQFLAAPQRDISIYSPRATALDWLIVSDEVKKRYPDTENDPHADHFHDRCQHINLYRTVASDFTVVRAVYKELKYRGVQNVGEIALVTERDTLYARLMSRYFNGCKGTAPIADRFTVTKFTEGDGDPDSDDADGDNSQPLCFTYLRGLDGLAPPTPGTGDSAQASSDAKAGTNAGVAPVPKAKESATGPGQLDYLRRLATALASRRDDPACGQVARILALRDQSEEGENRCGHRIKAIGVVGSDIYDKLLVLQALRRAFPRYIFFTTDLDARLTDAQDLQWTREMIIGSSLGLSLRPELQGSVPPFRDSYQAATFYSTMRAVHRFLDDDAKSNTERTKIANENTGMELSWTRRPHVFEIGRTQAFDLSAYKDSNVACDKTGECRSVAAWRQPPLWAAGSFIFDLAFAAVVVLIAILMTGAAMGTTWMTELVTQTPSASPRAAMPRKRLFVAVLLLALTACVSIMVWTALVEALTNGGKRIPTPIFSGANHWSASIVEALSILLVITLVLRGQRKLRTNAATMLKEFSFPLDGDTMADQYRDWLLTQNNHRRWKERLWFPIRRLSGNKGNPLVTPDPVNEKAPAPPLNGFSELEVLIGQYLYRGRWSARFVRVAIATAISSCVLLALEYALMLFEFNLGISLVTGFAFIDFHLTEPGVESFVSFINLLAIQFLIFWVADALFLTRSFMLALAKDEPLWPQPVLREQAEKLGLSDSWTAMWLDLRLIAWRTGRVANLIWYPSLMLAAMAVAALTVEFGQLGFASNPIALIISAGFVVGAAVMLRRVAEDWRSDVIFRLDNARLFALGAPDEKTAHVAQLDRLSERVRSLSDGAFAPYSQQPLVRAVFVPAITYGATVGLQYLHIGS
jgi:hypothetical protein